MYMFYSYVFNNQYSMTVAAFIIMWKADTQDKTKCINLFLNKLKQHQRKELLWMNIEEQIVKRKEQI